MADREFVTREGSVNQKVGCQPNILANFPQKLNANKEDGL